MHDPVVSLDEKRKSLRITTQLPITITRSTKPPVSGQLIDFSQTGLGLLLEEPLNPSEEATIKIDQPTSKESFETTARIVWQARTTDTTLIRHGVQMQLMDTIFHDKLQALANRPNTPPLPQDGKIIRETI